MILKVFVALAIQALCFFCWGMQVGERQAKLDKLAGLLAMGADLLKTTRNKMESAERLQRLLTAAKEAIESRNSHIMGRECRAFVALGRECEAADRELAELRAENKTV